MALTQLHDSEALAKDVDKLSVDLEGLRLSYEKYFLGFDRKEPKKRREDVVNLVRKLSSVGIQNARLKFKLQQTVARYNAHTIYWDRVLREIEEGRYERDLFKAKLHERERGVAPASPATATDKKTAKPDPLAALFDQYLTARKKVGEKTEGLNIDSFRKSLATQAEAIKKKTNCQTVRFQVITEGTQTKIKAIPIQKK